MSVYGPNPCTTVTQTGTGNVWNNPTYIEVLDGNSADSEPWVVVTAPGPVILGKDPYQSQQIVATGFGFSVPTGYIVTSIKASVWRYQTNPRYAGTNVTDLSIQLVIGGVPVGNNKASVANWDNTVTKVDYDYSTSAWGLGTVLWSTVNASDFGLSVQCQGTGGRVPYPFVGNPAPIGYIDYVTLTVTAVPGGCRILRGHQMANDKTLKSLTFGGSF